MDIDIDPKGTCKVMASWALARGFGQFFAVVSPGRVCGLHDNLTDCLEGFMVIRHRVL